MCYGNNNKWMWGKMYDGTQEDNKVIQAALLAKFNSMAVLDDQRQMDEWPNPYSPKNCGVELDLQTFRCQVCGEEFSRPKTRGRPPTSCHACQENKSQTREAELAEADAKRIQRAKARELDGVGYLDVDPPWVTKMREILKEE